MEEKNWYNKTAEEVIEELDSNQNNGLSANEIEERKQKYGLNQLAEAKKKSLFIKFLEQFKDFMIIVLIIAAIISGVVGHLQGEGITDSIIILIVVIVNAIIGVAQENKAEKSLDALKKLSSYSAKVIRDGKLMVVPSKELVPGDIVELETGDYVPADIRIVEAFNLKSQEASLTGESVPVEKMAVAIDEKHIGVGDRTNMLFSSSLITYGRGKGIVVETGMNTEVGKIAGMLNETESTDTPLQQRLNKLGKTLGIASLAICAVIFVIGLLYGKAPLDMFMTAVSLAVAVIPEGLAAVSTIVLAIGVQRMVKKHAIVKKLPAVETLGSATVICSDKTGTLTQNKMTVQKMFFNDEIKEVEKIDTNKDNEELIQLVYISMLCNDTKVGEDNKLTGDPTETALIDMGFRLDFKPELFELMPRVEEIPFDSDRKLMTTVHKVSDKKYMVYTKGGVDELLARCNSYVVNGKVLTDIEKYAETIDKYNDVMAEDALRVLAMAYKEIDHKPSKEEMKDIEKDLTYIGMVGMIDPPREEVKTAVEKCKTAGIKTVMITGDHKTTAVAIARQLGILEGDEEAVTGSDLEKMSQEELEKRVKNIRVYARVSPEHKVRIVKAWQANGEVVVLFFAILITPLLAQKFNIPINLIEPLLPIHILWINLVTDSLPALALAFDPANKNVMKRKPIKSNTGIFTKGMSWRIVYQGTMIGLLTLAAFIIGLSTKNPPVIEGLTPEEVKVEIAQTMTFIVLAFAELVHVFNIRNNKESIFKTGIGGNKQLFGAIGVSALLMIVILAIPALRAIFSIPVLPMENIVETVLLILAPIVIVEIFKLLKINGTKSEE